VVFEFDGQAPFRLTDAQIKNQSKLEIRSNNPVVATTLEMMAAFAKLQNANRPSEN
jgi:hypothetical protein